MKNASIFQFLGKKCFWRPVEPGWSTSGKILVFGTKLAPPVAKKIIFKKNPRLNHFQSATQRVCLNMPLNARNSTFYTENHGKSHKNTEISVISRKNQDFQFFFQNLQK